MTVVRQLQAAVLAALVTGVAIHAQGRLDATSERTFGGTYSPNCGNAEAPRLRVTAEALFVEEGTRRMQASNPTGAFSYFGPAPPPAFQITLMGDVRPGIGLMFHVYRDTSGYYIKVDGHPTVLANLGKVLVSQTYRRCSNAAQGGIITTVAGSSAFCDKPGDEGPATNAQLCFPNGVAVDKAGNFYIANTRSYRIAKVDTAGIIHNLAGSGHNPMFTGDGGPAISATLSHPFDVALDAAGNLYLSDSSNQRIRKITPNGVISTIASAGNPGGFSGDGGPAVQAKLNQPRGVAVDAAGNIYIADNNTHRVRKVIPNGTISTVAGSGPLSGGYGGDGGPSTSAQVFNPLGLAADLAGNLYISDQGNNRIRKIATDGTISTVAGNGQLGFSGDGGPAIQARLNNPQGVAVDAAGNLYIADYVNNRVRKVSPSGTITTVAGTGVRGFSGDGGPATNAQLGTPAGVAVDAAGNLYIVDQSNHRVRKVTFGAADRLR